MRDGEVPGYDAVELLGYGTTGEVWRARERSSGQLVVLRRLAGADRDAVAQVRRQATVVRSLPTRHLVRLRTVTRAQGDDVLVLDHAAAGSLAALLAVRGTLTPGEVVTVLAPLAEALGHAHSHGLVHRRLGAARVLLTPEGMPLLEGLGLDPLYDAADGLDPTGVLGSTADVWALGALGHLMLTGEAPCGTPLREVLPTAPLPLLAALDSAVAFDPAERPAAADLAAGLLAACAAAPLQGMPDVPEIAPPRPRARRRLPVPALALAGAAAVLLAVVALGWTWGARSGDATASVPRAAGTDWPAVVRSLDAVRAGAFAHGDPTALAGVYAAGSPLLAADQASLAALAARHATASGLRHQVLEATLLSTGPSGAVVRVRELLSEYALVDRAGRVVERHGPGPVVTEELVLVSGSAGWRVRLVRRST
jgi:hypothetical protein